MNKKIDNEPSTPMGRNGYRIVTRSVIAEPL